MKKMANDLWSPADNLPEMEEDDEEYWEVICCNLCSHTRALSHLACSVKSAIYNSGYCERLRHVVRLRQHFAMGEQA